MDKAGLLAAIVAHFQHEQSVLQRSAQANYEAATHEENIAENKYDTRGLEASYMAESQAKRVREMQQTVATYSAMIPRSFTEDEVIGPGALITLTRSDGVSFYYFLGPRGGGAQLVWSDRKISIVTPAAPLGKALLGAEPGDEVSVAGRTYEITEIQ